MIGHRAGGATGKDPQRVAVNTSRRGIERPKAPQAQNQSEHNPSRQGEGCQRECKGRVERREGSSQRGDPDHDQWEDYRDQPEDPPACTRMVPRCASPCKTGRPRRSVKISTPTTIVGMIAAQCGIRRYPVGALTGPR